MAGSENEHTNSSSSGEEEEELESTQGSDSEPETEPEKTPPKQTLTPTLSSSDDSDSDDGETPAIAPVKEVEKPTSKNQSALPAVVKRPAAEIDGGDVKRARKETVIAVAAPDSVNGVGAERKDPKQLFARLWSRLIHVREIEIVLIEGMINYVNEIKKDPIAKINDFYEFVKGDVHVDVTTSQMLNKTRAVVRDSGTESLDFGREWGVTRWAGEWQVGRAGARGREYFALRKKYENNYAKFEKSGKVRSFSNQHERRMYDLSQNLWGSDGNNNVAKSSKRINVTSKVKKSKKSGLGNGNVNMDFEVEPKMVQPVRSWRGPEQLGSMGLMVTDEGIMSKGLELLTGAKKAEMEEKWKELKVQELEHFVRKVELLKEQAEVVLDAVTRSGAN
ncbi:GLABROUS1 enhancer-binding protein-like protein [Tanacetum coccineum]